MISGDYHTHTTFSHGISSIEENVAEANKKGLKEIAITDHGLRHVAFGMKRREIPVMQKLIGEAQEKFPDVRILYGVEANIYSSQGDIDLKPSDMECFDIVIAGYHKAVWPKNPWDLCRFNLGASMHNAFGYGKKAVQRFTDAYVKAIKSGKVDVITHPNYGIKTDIRQVAQAAKDYGVLLELNGKRISMTDEEILTIVDVGAGIIVNSDAHACGRVGDVSLPLERVEKLKIDKNLIVNWEKLPEFKRKKR